MGPSAPETKRRKTSMTPEGAAMAATVREMDASQGFDAVVVCTSNVAQERYWQTRLQATAGQAAKSGAIVVAVHEDWAADGAGNGLGTLYAYAKAKAKAQASGHDLDALLARGGTVGIYHTAGKGTRLAPLPGAENNNKPGVKLPSLVDLPADPATGAPASTTELTILEAVVRQTGVYAKHRPGRCSVFWGDQIFVPSAGHNPSGAHHADILAQMGPMPDEADWKAKGLDKYGLIAVNAAGEAAQVEKVSYDTATRLLAGFGQLAAVGPSLGSFSLGAEMLSSLMTEFAPELETKTAKMDSDPHFWMPMTLEKKAYVSVMVTKDETEATAGAHWDRVAAFKAKLLASHPDRGLFGAIDVGEKCYWWDYGQLGLYRKNNALAMEASEEAAALREYLKIPENGPRSLRSDLGDATLEDDSVALATRVRSGKLVRTIASHVTANAIDAEGCILINVTAKSIRAKNCIVYNVEDDSEEGLALPEGAVMTNVFVPGREKLVQSSSVGTDGGKVFKVKLTQNPFSFQDVYKMNQTTDVEEAYAVGRKAHEETAKKIWNQ